METYFLEKGKWQKLNASKKNDNVHIIRGYNYVVTARIELSVFHRIDKGRECVRSVTIPSGFLSKTENILLEWLYSVQATNDGDPVGESEAIQLHLVFLSGIGSFWKKALHLCYQAIGIFILDDSWESLGERGPEYYVTSTFL